MILINIIKKNGYSFMIICFIFKIKYIVVIIFNICIFEGFVCWVLEIDFVMCMYSLIYIIIFIFDFFKY